MKPLLIAILLCFSICRTTAQSIAQIDSISVKICESLDEKTMMDQPDSIKVSYALSTHLPEFFDSFPKMSEKLTDSIADRIFFRLQKQCSQFTRMVNDMSGVKDDGMLVRELPTVAISDTDAKRFMSGGFFYYTEPNGGTVDFDIAKGKWTEHFADGTTSKLNFKPGKKGEFDLQFIESNNRTRQNLSVRGDVYHYGLISFAEGKYTAWVKLDKGYYIFPIFVRK